MLIPSDILVLTLRSLLYISVALQIECICGGTRDALDLKCHKGFGRYIQSTFFIQVVVLSDN